ncbi:MAG: hypothetical protein LBI66_09755 [Burkholderiaceae bacterium]|jgi:hypothetical protein|nr:hypothetical protein [Burkholderiaceae bacterium]
MYRHLRAGLIALACSTAFMALAGTPVQVPGTTVRMSPPAGFEPATQFAGFVAPASQASILLAEMPGEAHGQLAPLFANEKAGQDAFAAKGIRVERRTTIATASGEVPVLIGTQQAQGQGFRKWMALFHGDKVVLATVQAPAASGLSQAEVLAALASVQLGPPPSPQQVLDALPFTARAVAPFRVIDTMGGAGLAMTAGDRDRDAEGRQPLIVVASSLSPPGASQEAGALARALLAQTHGLEQARIESSGSAGFAGTQATVLRGRTPQGRQFVQYLSLWPGERYIRLVAMLPADGDAALLTAVEAIAASVAFR